MKRIRSTCVLRKYTDLIRMCNEKTICRVWFLQNDSKLFEGKFGGIRQGYIILSILFNIVGTQKNIRDMNVQGIMEISG